MTTARVTAPGEQDWGVVRDVRLAALTRPSDWISEDRSPVIYAEAGEVAKMLGLSQPRLRAVTVERT